MPIVHPISHAPWHVLLRGGLLMVQFWLNLHAYIALSSSCAHGLTVPEHIANLFHCLKYGSQNYGEVYVCRPGAVHPPFCTHSQESSVPSVLITVLPFFGRKNHSVFRLIISDNRIHTQERVYCDASDSLVLSGYDRFPFLCKLSTECGRFSF